MLGNLYPVQYSFRVWGRSPEPQDSPRPPSPASNTTTPPPLPHPQFPQSLHPTTALSSAAATGQDSTPALIPLSPCWSRSGEARDGATQQGQGVSFLVLFFLPHCWHYLASFTCRLCLDPCPGPILFSVVIYRCALHLVTQLRVSVSSGPPLLFEENRGHNGLVGPGTLPQAWALRNGIQNAFVRAVVLV